MTAKNAVSGTSYLRLPSDTIFYYDGSSYTNDTLEAQSSAGTAFTILADNTDDLFYIGLEQKFGTINIDIDGPGDGGSDQGVGITLSAEYYSTAWSSLTITSDGTSNLYYDGNIGFTAPGNWAQTAVNGITKYWVRLKTTTNPTNIPKARSIYTFGKTVEIVESATSNYLSYIVTNSSIIASDDVTAPTVSSADITTADGSYKTGQNIDITVSYNKAVLVVGSPRIQLNVVGGATRYAAYNSGSGSANLVFRYTAQAGDNIADLGASGIDGLGLNGGTIKDAAGNDAVNTLPNDLTAGNAVVIDTTAPTNQNTVFAANVTKQGGASVTIVSSGDAANNVWFAPSGTTTFTAGPTMTMAGGTATSILAPATAGAYKLFVIDAAGNVSAESTAALTVDNTQPPPPDTNPPPTGGWFPFDPYSPTGPADANEEIVYQVFQNLLGRDPDRVGLSYYKSLIVNSGWTREMIEGEIKGSNEYKSRQINLIYLELLGRSGDAGGISWYLDSLLNRGWTFGRIIADIKTSPEYKVKSAFRDLLARWPDAGGFNWYFNLMNRGFSETQLRNELMNSSEYKNSQVSISFRQLLGRDPDPEALNWYNNQLRNGWTVEWLWSNLRGSPEFGNYTRNQIIAAYQNFLGRNPDDGGLNYYFNLVKNSGWTVLGVRNNIMSSPESWQRR